MQEGKDVHANCLLTVTCMPQSLPSGLLHVTHAGVLAVKHTGSVSRMFVHQQQHP